MLLCGHNVSLRWGCVWLSWSVQDAQHIQVPGCCSKLSTQLEYFVIIFQRSIVMLHWRWPLDRVWSLSTTLHPQKVHQMDSKPTTGALVCGGCCRDTWTHACNMWKICRFSGLAHLKVVKVVPSLLPPPCPPDWRKALPIECSRGRRLCEIEQFPFYSLFGSGSIHLCMSMYHNCPVQPNLTKLIFRPL